MIRLFVFLVVLVFANTSVHADRSADLGACITAANQKHGGLMTDAWRSETAACRDAYNTAGININLQNPVLVQQNIDNPELPDTRANTKCENISAEHFRTKAVQTFRKCTTGQTSYNVGNQIYYLGETVFNGLITQQGSKYVYHNQNEITQFTNEEKAGTTIDQEALPDAINCGNPQRRSKYQCLVCNCFHEARGTSFNEQVMVNRTVLSRVLSPKHPSNACDVVYHPNAYSWTHENVKNADGSNKLNSSGDAITSRSVVLDESSSQFLEIYGAGEVNSLRTCKRSSLESLKYEKEFFAVAYAVKGKEYPYHRTCQAYADLHVGDNVADFTDSRGRMTRSFSAQQANVSLNSDPNLAHRFYSVCEPKEERCLYYPTCELAPSRSARPVSRPGAASGSLN